MSLFRGGAASDDAEAVLGEMGASPETLFSLTDRSLLRAGGGRFDMLETVREYAHEHLVESGRHLEAGRAPMPCTLPTWRTGRGRGSSGAHSSSPWPSWNKSMTTSEGRWAGRLTTSRPSASASPPPWDISGSSAVSFTKDAAGSQRRSKCPSIRSWRRCWRSPTPSWPGHNSTSRKRSARRFARPEARRLVG